MPAAVTRFLAAVSAYDRKFGGAGGVLRHYPGSPRLVRAGLRAGDRFVACELHPQDALALKREFAGDRAVEVREEDGYHAIKASLPPAERRGLVLIDPPFEATDEFDKLTRALRQGLRRFATGCYVVWYPIKDEPAGGGFLATFPSLKSLRLALRRPPPPPGKIAAPRGVGVNTAWKCRPGRGRSPPSVRSPP